MPSSASRRRRRNKPAPPAPHPEAVGRVKGPPATAVPQLPPPAAFARNRNPRPVPEAAAAAAERPRARGPAAVRRLPPPSVFARKPAPGPDAAAAERAGHPMEVPRLPPPATFLRVRGLDPAAVAGEARDWAALPLDALAAVLRRLDHVEILMGPGQVCRSWRRAARDDPGLWRRIDMRGHADLYRRVDLCRMARAAIRRAKGRCEAFWAEYAADDDVLMLLGEQAPSLKSLRLISCQEITEFEEAITKFPLLEELEISLFTNIGGKHVFEAVGQACPELKHFRFNSYRFINSGNRGYSDDDDDYYDYDDKDDDALGIASMPGLRTLQLFGNNLINEGLAAILCNCPHLESLDIRHCFNIIVDDNLRAMCARIRTLKLPYDSTDDYGFPVCSPLWSFGSASESDDYENYSDYGGYDYILDSDEYDDYCDPFRYLNGVYEDELGPEDRMFLKGMRKLMKQDDY